MKAGFNITCVGDNRDYSYIFQGKEMATQITSQNTFLKNLIKNLKNITGMKEEVMKEITVLQVLTYLSLL